MGLVAVTFLCFAGKQLERPACCPTANKKNRSLVQLSAEVEPVSWLVVPLGHAAHWGVGLSSLPPADHVPAAQVAVQLGPPRPGAHTGQVHAGEVRAACEAWAWVGLPHPSCKGLGSV